jgi:hypothetical protein
MARNWHFLGPVKKRQFYKITFTAVKSLKVILPESLKPEFNGDTNREN